MLRTIALATAVISAQALHVSQDDDRLITEPRDVVLDTSELLALFDRKPRGEDAVADAQLSGREWKKAYKTMMKLAGETFERGDGKAAFEDVDVSGDGFVDADEFRTWVCSDLDLCDDEEGDE